MNNGEKDGKLAYIITTIFLVVFILGGAAILIFGKDKDDNNVALQKPTPSGNITSSESTTPGVISASPSGKIMDNVTDLQIVDEKVGTGEAAVAGKSVSVNYTGTLTNGTVFDSNVVSSFGHVEPFTFTLGAGQVIPGWDKGVAGMKVGGKRKLIIPSSMAYGDSGVPGAIPGGATLVFEVELLKVQ